jgi:hypothetical protein
MKLLNKGMLVVLFSLIATTSFAQTIQSKQNIFAAYPQNIAIDNVVLSNSISFTKGSTVTLNLSNEFQFTGTVFFNEKIYDNLQTVMIRALDNAKSVFEITKLTNKDNSFEYRGRIMNNDAADGYEIKNINGNYTLQKFETQKILEVCK